MMRMKKRALCVALATAMGAAGSAHAVNVNSDGLGEVLLFPFYTVEAGATNINIVNTTNRVKAVKVRFVEANNSLEVLDFNLYLSPEDVWTGTVVATEDGAELITSDNTCTVPPIPAGGVAFSTVQIEDFNDELTQIQSADQIAARVREGHVEIIEMGEVANTGTNGNAATAATHINGVPDDCAQLNDNWRTGGAWQVDNTDGLTEPTGGLFGNGSIVDVAEGTAYSYEARALDDFSEIVLHSNPAFITPALSDANPTVSRVFYDGGVVESTWVRGIDAVSAVLMHQAVMNEYGLDSFTDAGTDIVVTFPTKNDYVNSISAVAPFTSTFEADGACETIEVELYDREEQGLSPADVGFSPRRGPTGFSLCWEANVVTIDDSDVLEARNTRVALDGNNFENGWVRMTFSGAGQEITSVDGDTYQGLPTIGFAVQQHLNGGASSAFAGTWENRHTKSISSIDTGPAL